MRRELILHGGNIHTMDESLPWAQAVAIAGERIVAVGSDEEVKGLFRPGAETIDLRGRTVIPGLIDCHIHFASYALNLDGIELRGTESLEGALAMIAARVKDTAPGEWIRGFGWDESAWEEARFPDRFHLDRVAPRNPVALARKDGHLYWVNSLALQEAGIGREVASPSGGAIDRDPVSSDPTGILRERAVDLVRDVIPPPTQSSPQRALRRAVKEVHRLGITGIHTPERKEVFQAWQRLLKQGELDMRVYILIPAEALEVAIALGLETGFGSAHLRIGPVKLFADGSLGSQTADMLEPFLGQRDNRGIAVTPKEELRRLVERASAAGIATAIHAIGDGANRKVLDIFQTLGEKRNWRLRHRIEHAQLLHPDDIPRLGRLGIIASMQPVHATSDMHLANRFWGERCRGAYAWRKVLATGGRLAFGSDCPVETMNPFRGICAAVTRKREDGYPPGGWYAEECLSVGEALRAYTLGAAYASGEEGLKGSLTAGKLADLVVLPRDIFTIPPEEILETEVDITIFDGKIVYVREGI